MKLITVAIATVLSTLALYSTTASAGPDFSLIEQARAQKKAEVKKAAETTIKCLADKVASDSLSK